MFTNVLGFVRVSVMEFVFILLGFVGTFVVSVILEDWVFDSEEW